ncbi:hypothetical protein WBG78_27315 [Chryseolinea sp. T2]|uniref:hypothetical protein n=1 Tax=Chryseolinea sp. T2 TaxID=3129255 RepID=UPI00307886AC
MKDIIGDILSGKLFGRIKELIDEVVTTNEEKEALHIKLRELEIQHTEVMAKSALADLQSARQREVDVKKSGSLNFTQDVLAYMAIVAFFSMTGYILANGVGLLDADESFIIGNLTGMAAAIAKDIYGYYFGSSKGDQLLFRNASKKQSNNSTIKQTI